MRRGWLLICALLASMLAGCLSTSSVRPKNWFERLRPFQGPTGPDVVTMDIAILDCPLGDHYINQELWSRADEQVIELERKALLEENGLRVGQVGGIAPAELQALLTSERTNGKPRRIMLHAGHSTTIELGPPLPVCNIDVHAEGKDRALGIVEAECQFEVTPSLSKDGRTRLHFAPKIQHGAAALIPRPAADRSCWEYRSQRPTETFTTLGWEVTLAPNEYVIIGGRYDRPGTLGHEFFLRKDGTPAQKLIVIRTGRSADAVEVADSSGGERKAAPLAIQAAYTVTRGQGRDQ
ncbi:MAG: hypothetical protein AB7K24_16630 [Gemmataceae bacterium]